MYGKFVHSRIWKKCLKCTSENDERKRANTWLSSDRGQLIKLFEVIFFPVCFFPLNTALNQGGSSSTECDFLKKGEWEETNVHIRIQLCWLCWLVKSKNAFDLANTRLFPLWGHGCFWQYPESQTSKSQVCVILLTLGSVPLSINAPTVSLQHRISMF